MVANVPEGLANRHLGVHPRTEAVLIAQQVRLEDRPQHQQRRHLDHAVADARDAERALAAVALWYPYAQQGLWPIVASPQLLPQLFQPSILPVGGDLIERHPVAAGSTVITPACPVCFFEDVSPTHFVPQRVEPKVRFGLSPIFRLGLYFNPLISWQEVPRNSGNCAQLLATIEQSADRRPRQLTVGAGLIESEKARYFRAIFCTQ